MKKFISGLIIGTSLTFSITTFANSELLTKINPFPVLVDGVRQTVDAYNINGSTYIKLSDIAKTTNDVIKVKFDGENKTININTTDNKVITKPIEEPVKEDKVVNDITAKKVRETPDGIKLDHSVFGNEYVGLSYIRDKYNIDNFDIDLVRVMFLSSDGQIIAKNTTEPIDMYVDGEIVLRNIPYKHFGDWYIGVEYDYYVNTIMPLLQK